MFSSSACSLMFGILHYRAPLVLTYTLRQSYHTPQQKLAHEAKEPPPLSRYQTRKHTGLGTRKQSCQVSSLCSFESRPAQGAIESYQQGGGLSPPLPECFPGPPGPATSKKHPNTTGQITFKDTAGGGVLRRTPAVHNLRKCQKQKKGTTIPATTVFTIYRPPRSYNHLYVEYFN